MAGDSVLNRMQPLSPVVSQPAPVQTQNSYGAYLTAEDARKAATADQIANQYVIAPYWQSAGYTPGEQWSHQSEKRYALAPPPPNPGFRWDGDAETWAASRDKDWDGQLGDVMQVVIPAMLSYGIASDIFGGDTGAGVGAENSFDNGAMSSAVNGDAGLLAVNSFDSGAMAQAVSGGSGTSIGTGIAKAAAEAGTWLKEAGQYAKPISQILGTAAGAKAVFDGVPPTKQPTGAGYLGPNGEYVEYPAAGAVLPRYPGDQASAAPASFDFWPLLILGGLLLLGQ